MFQINDSTIQKNIKFHELDKYETTAVGSVTVFTASSIYPFYSPFKYLQITFLSNGKCNDDLNSKTGQKHCIAQLKLKTTQIAQDQNRKQFYY